MFSIEKLPTFYSDCLTSLENEVKSVDRKNLVSHFKKKHNINVKERKDTLKFKYDACCKFKNPCEHACRGTMISSDGTLIPSINKFFNCHELHKYGYSYDKLWEEYSSTNTFTMKAFAKMDGTNMQITYLSKEDRFEITTLGSLNPCVMQGKIPNSPTFEEKFRELVGEKLLDYLKKHPDISLIFEMCSRFNTIVTKYNKEFVTLITIIDLKSRLPIYNKSIINDLKAIGIDMAQSWDISKNKEKGLKQIDNIFKEMIEKPEVFGENPEGVVLTLFFLPSPLSSFESISFTMIPFVKLKRREYLMVHHSSNFTINVGDFKDKCIVEMKVLKGEDDDLPEVVQQEHASLFKDFLNKVCEEITEVLKDVDSETSKKEYATKVNNMGLKRKEGSKEGKEGKWIAPFMFEKKNKLLSEENEVWELLTEWLLMKVNKEGKTRIESFQGKGTVDKMWFLSH